MIVATMTLSVALKEVSIKNKGVFLLWVTLERSWKPLQNPLPSKLLEAFSMEYFSVLRVWSIFAFLFTDSLARAGRPNRWNSGNFWTDELQRFSVPDDHLWLGTLQLCAWGKCLLESERRYCCDSGQRLPCSPEADMDVCSKMETTRSFMEIPSLFIKPVTKSLCLQEKS